MKCESKQELVLLDLFKNNCEMNLRISIIEPINETWKFMFLSNFQKGSNGIVIADKKIVMNECSNIFSSDIIYNCDEKEVKEKIDSNEYVICIVDSYYLKGHIYYSRIHKNTMIIIYGYMDEFYKVFMNRRMLGLEKGEIKISALENMVYKGQIKIDKPGVKDFMLTKYPNTTLYLNAEKLTKEIIVPDLRDYYFKGSYGIQLLEELFENIEEYIESYHNRKLDYLLVNSLANIIEVKKIHYMIYKYTEDKDMLLHTEKICDCLARIKFALGRYLYTNRLDCLKYIKDQLQEIFSIENICKTILY